MRRTTNFTILICGFLGIVLCVIARSPSMPPEALFCIAPLGILLGAAWIVCFIMDILDSSKSYLKQWLNE